MEKQEVNFDFTGKNYVVVGASSGMGRQVAIELAEAGANVLAIARNEERLNQLKDKCSNIHIQILDVTQAGKDDWLKIFDEYVKDYGKIDGAVYTAGISGTTALRRFDEDFAYKIMETSFWGAIRCLQAITKKKISNACASYILFSSVAGTTGEKGLFAYAAAKAALMAAVKSLSHDLSREKQRINTISPGWVETNMTTKSIEEMGESVCVVNRHLLGTGQATDVSPMVMFLLSERASWITGQDFVVDGGYMSGAWN